MWTHTPGKWTVGNPPDGTRGYVYSDDATGSAIAQVQFAYVARPEQETEANARLIAAAPDLLEACELIIGSVRIPDDEVSQEVLRRLRLAVRKATGA